LYVYLVCSSAFGKRIVTVKRAGIRKKADLRVLVQVLIYSMYVYVYFISLSSSLHRNGSISG